MDSIRDYSEVFYEYKETMSVWAIYKSIPTVYKRTMIYLRSGGIVIAEMILMMFHQDDLRYALLTGVTALIYLPIINIVMYYNKKDLLKFYSKIYKFSEVEEKDISSILDRIRKEKFNAHLGQNIGNVDYIRNLAENAREKATESKKEFKLQELGLATILAIVLNSFFGMCYDLWKSYHNFDFVFQRTLFIICGIIIIYSIYAMLKEFIMDLRNSDHNAHKKLYDMLRNRETKAMFKN
jgi:hypothetical protein